MVAARWPGCPEACGLLLVQGLNPCHLHWQVEAWLLDHQGSLLLFLNSRVLKARGSPRLPPAPVFSSACLEAVLPTPGCLNFGAGWAWWVWVATSLSSLPLDLLSPACLHCELPRWLSGEESACQGRRCRFDPWVGKDPLEEEVATHSSILAWRIPRQKSLVGYSAWGPKESDTTEQLRVHACIVRRPALVAVRWQGTRLLWPSTCPCFWLSWRPMPGSHFACKNCGPVSMGNWYMCMHTCNRKHQNVWAVFRENSKQQIAKLLFMFLFLAFLLCTCVIGILEHSAIQLCLFLSQLFFLNSGEDTIQHQ